MEAVYGALLLHKSGHPINEENLKKVLESAGAKVEEAKIKALIAALEGVDIEKAIKEAATVTTAAPIAAEQAPAKKKEEKKEEKKDDAAAGAGLGALFGG